MYQQIQQQEFQRTPSMCHILCHFWMAISMCMFTFYDFIIAYSTTPCYSAITQYQLPVQTWLILSGWLGFAIVVYSLLYRVGDTNPCQRAINLFYDMLLLLSAMWNIVGHTLLWLHYSDYLHCSLEIFLYLTIRLCVGTIINFFQLYLNYRQVPL